MRGSLLVAVLGVALLALPAAAKEGMRAKLDGPVRLDAAPGETIRVAWHLVDTHGRAFGDSRIYLRVSRCRGKPIPVAATQEPGGYSARVKVPRGGIRKLLVGLKGWQIVGERRKRADMFFQFDPPLYRSCQHRGSVAGGGSSSSS